MGPAKKKNDPISDRSRALTDQIAALETEIRKLDTQLHRVSAPKFRSTAIPHGATVARASELSAPEPVFEEVKSLRDTETAAPDQFNELGVRKYDLPGLFSRIRNHFRRPTTNNPRLVAYLAAGGVHGLRPMRYEKRVARARFIVLAIVLFAILFGTLLVYLGHH
jgi:cell division protein FtsB